MDKKNNMMMWVMIAGGAGLAYWYVTTYGPAGKVSEAGGRTWWETWFGPDLSTVTNQFPNTVPQPGQQYPNQQPPAQLPAPSVQTQQPNQQPPPTTGPPPVAATSLRNQVAAAGAAEGNMLNADKWNWYYGAVTGQAQTADLFPPNDRGYLMSVDEYFQRRASAGLSGIRGVGAVADIIPATAVSSVPSMSFGGGMSGMGSPFNPSGHPRSRWGVN